MHIQQTNIYKPKFNQPKFAKKLISAQVAMLSIFALVTIPSAGTNDHIQPREQQFVLTGYYSPLEGQCCYVKGGVKADRILNGEGHTAADGTPVYPGLIAAPGTYAFGTVVELPGYGVFKVHDRGGAIQEWDNGKHRLDLWVGFGEEGLARALQLGLKEVKGTIYPPGGWQPEVSFNFDTIAAPVYQLERFQVHSSLLAVTPAKEDSGLSVSMLQERLQTLGYLDQAPTGYFGPKTEEALAQFLTDFRIDQPSTHLTTVTAAHLLAATVRKEALLPLDAHVNDGAAEQDIIDAQRILSSIGYYHGRKDGKYDSVREAILKFQQDEYLVGTAADPGAGQIGPITKRSLQAAWNRKLVSTLARKYLGYAQAHQTVRERGKTIESFAQEGSFGTNVLNLQYFLASKGYFAAEEANGNFGSMTKQAVIQYQIDHKLISSSNSEGAGVVGPKTLAFITQELGRNYYATMRSFGLNAL